MVWKTYVVEEEEKLKFRGSQYSDYEQVDFRSEENSTRSTLEGS